MLGSAVNFLLANARLVLGVGGAAVLGIATLAVKRVRPWWTSYTGGSRRRITGLGPAAGPWEGAGDCPRLASASLPSKLVCFALGLRCAAQASDALICATLPAAH